MSREGHEEALFVDRAEKPGTVAPDFMILQRVVVRMLFDPAFVTRVYESEGAELDGLNLPKDAVQQLIANDRRLWNADRLRRRRALKILMEEFRISSALVLLHTNKLAVLDAFFSSGFFHESVQQRQYMAPAFRAYLESLIERHALGDTGFPEVLLLEGGLAESRRELKDARRGWDRLLDKTRGMEPGAYFLCAPGVMSVEIPNNTLELISRMEEYLFESSLIPALALCDDAPKPQGIPTLNSEARDCYLIEGDESGKVDFNKVEKRFAELIDSCRAPKNERQLRRELRKLDLSREQIKQMTHALKNAGILRRLVIQKV
ncbi:MAG: hypothetical protein P1V97_24825 [Planctomycetota bacterium]|nr:hypothetical protein [Planctomycetota bacterium]